MDFKNTLTSNWENSFRGLRNPMNSWHRSDSRAGLGQLNSTNLVDRADVADFWMQKEYPNLNPLDNSDEYTKKAISIENWLDTEGEIRSNDIDNIVEYFYIGPNDMDLAKRMIAAGSPNDKFLRQIFVSVDITAPLYLWKELDTYKVGTTANSTSTMHKLASTPITKNCFEMDDYSPIGRGNDKSWELIIGICEDLRLKYLETKDIRYWKELIRILPESWLQTRTWTANYSVLRNIVKWRSTHKLTEWHQFVDWCATLPYARDLIFYDYAKELTFYEKKVDK